MSTNYHRQRESLPDGGPMWRLVMIVFLVALGLIGLPTIVIGYLAQRGLSRWITSWRVRFFLWLLLGTISAFLLYLHRDVIQILITKELMAYIITLKDHQMDVGHWAGQMLWAETWRTWIQTLFAVPIMGFWQELGKNTTTDMVHALEQKQRRRQQRNISAQKRARRRTQRSQRLPDTLGNEMVIGVPIQRQEDE